MNLDFKIPFIMGTEIPQCPFCGSRTQIIFELYHTMNKLQIHRCLSTHNSHEFMLVEDKNTSS